MKTPIDPLNVLSSTGIRRTSRLHHILWFAYLIVIIGTELALTFWIPSIALGVYLALLVILLIYASFGAEDDRPFALTLMFVPLIRIVGLSLPLATAPLLYWYLAPSIPLFIAAILAIRVLRLTRQQLSISIGNLSIQLGIGLLGFPLAIAYYVIRHPTALATRSDWQTILFAGLVVFVSVGVFDEFVFRGIMQACTCATVGRLGIAYVSAIYAVLQIGERSLITLAFVFGVGLLFGWLVAWTGSILGTTIAHTVIVVGAFLIIPNLPLSP